MFDTIVKPTYLLPEVVVKLSWQLIKLFWFHLWLETVLHNGLDTEVYDLRPADYTTTASTTLINKIIHKLIKFLSSTVNNRADNRSSTA